MYILRVCACTCMKNLKLTLHKDKDTAYRYITLYKHHMNLCSSLRSHHQVLSSTFSANHV